MSQLTEKFEFRLSRGMKEALEKYATKKKSKPAKILRDHIKKITGLKED